MLPSNSGKLEKVSSDFLKDGNVQETVSPQGNKLHNTLTKEITKSAEKVDTKIQMEAMKESNPTITSTSTSKDPSSLEGETSSATSFSEEAKFDEKSYLKNLYGKEIHEHGEKLGVDVVKQGKLIDQALKNKNITFGKSIAMGANTSSKGCCDLTKIMGIMIGVNLLLSAGSIGMLGNVLYAESTQDNSTDVGPEDGGYLNETLESPVKDIALVFLVDGSSSVTHDGFQDLKQWIVNATVALKTIRPSTKVGLVQYSRYNPSISLQKQPMIETEVSLGGYNSTEDFRNQVTSTHFHGSTTYTSIGMLKTIADFKDFDEYCRVMLVITDGKSMDSYHLQAVSDTLVLLDITPMAVGVNSAVESELLKISAGRKMNKFRVEKFSDLSSIQDDIVKAATRICPTV